MQCSCPSLTKSNARSNRVFRRMAGDIKMFGKRLRGIFDGWDTIGDAVRVVRGREMRTSLFEFCSTHFAGTARKLASAHKFLPRSVEP